MLADAPTQVFNKGSLFDIGFVVAKQRGHDYLILHDVDQVSVYP